MTEYPKWLRIYAKHCEITDHEYNNRLSITIHPVEKWEARLARGDKPYSSKLVQWETYYLHEVFNEEDMDKQISKLRANVKP